MSLAQRIKDAKTLEQKAQVVWDHYESRRLQGPLEPHWIHEAYKPIQTILTGRRVRGEDRDYVREIVHSHGLPDGYTVQAFPGMPGSPVRVIHDGWKVGTPTWIFMGRNLTPDAVKYLGEGWVAVKRTAPPEIFRKLAHGDMPDTLWIAYQLDQPMGGSALTANCIGPCFDLEDVIEGVEDEIGRQLPQNPEPPKPPTAGDHQHRHGGY